MFGALADHTFFRFMIAAAASASASPHAKPVLAPGLNTGFAGVPFYATNPYKVRRIERYWPAGENACSMV